MYRLRTALCALAALAAAAACGGGGAGGGGSGVEEVLAALAGLTGQARAEKLLELVEAEGAELSFYTSMSPSVVDPVVDAFEEAYDVDVALYRATSEAVLQRLLEEAKAGFRGSDVVESSPLQMVALAGEGILAGYESPAAAAIVEGTREDGWTVDRFNTFVVSWNMDLVPSGEEPRSWEDLADPRWQGRLGLELGDVDWFKTLWEWWVANGKSEEEAGRLFEGMAANALVVKGHTVLAELTAAGEVAVAVNYRHLVQNVAADGAPLAWEPAVEPVVRRGNGVGVVRGAKHPAAALLFVDWLLSEGQETLAEVNTDPVRRDLAGGGAGALVVDPVALAAGQEEWADRWEALLRLGQAVG